MVAQSGDVVASGGGSYFFLFCFSVFFLLSVFLYLFHFFFALVFLLFFFHSPLCVRFILFFSPLVFFSISHQFSPLCSSLLFSSMFPFFHLPSSSSVSSSKIVLFIPLSITSLVFSLLSHRLLKGVFIGARGAGATLPLYSHEDRVGWLRRPLCSRPELPAGHGSHAPSMMVVGHKGRGFMSGFGQVGRERERENIGEQNFFFPCCVSRGRRSIVSFKTTLFCGFFLMNSA